MFDVGEKGQSFFSNRVRPYNSYPSLEQKLVDLPSPFASENAGRFFSFREILKRPQ